ncbi:hypothetical protein HY968_00270 [Candidatus Kaiserbacteria bacterium]|nr:hypothetical protein [Candidatus Kaiserbacteria bacterium]
MFLSRLFSRKEKIVIVVDIGSASASVSIVALRKYGPSKVLSSHRVALAMEDRLPDHAAQAMGRAITEASQKSLASPIAHEAPQDVFAIVRAPWTSSTSERVTQIFPAETRITDEVIAGMAKAALAQARNLDTQNLLEAKVIRMELDGYQTQKPAGKHARGVSVSALLTTIQPSIRESCERALSVASPAHKIKFRSHTRALLMIASQTENYADAIIIDMGSEGTGITSVKKGVVSSVELDVGTHSILLTIGSGPPEETLTLMRMLEDEKCDTDACKALSAALGKAEPELTRKFGDSFVQLGKNGHLQNDLLLLVHPDMAPWLARFLERIDFSQFTITTQPFIAHILSSQDMWRYVRAETGVSVDTSAAVAIAHVHIEELLD